MIWVEKWIVRRTWNDRGSGGDLGTLWGVDIDRFVYGGYGKAVAPLDPERYDERIDGRRVILPRKLSFTALL
jgi:hypothetical protein